MTKTTRTSTPATTSSTARLEEREHSGWIVLQPEQHLALFEAERLIAAVAQKRLDRMHIVAW
jgi:hypothetical protein